MSTFRSVSRWLLTGSLLVLLALVGLIAVGRFIYPTAAQREAVAELERWPSYEGENAAALLWSLHYDVPMADLDRVFASDMARKEQIRRAFDEGLAPASDPSAFVWASTRESYGSLAPNLEHAPELCRRYQTGCLARVRGDLPAYGAWAASAAALLERTEALQGYDFIRYPVRGLTWQPDGHLRRVEPRLLNWRAFSRLRTRYALQFAQGETTAALAGLCRNLLTWRRLGAQSDTLIWQMDILGASEGDSMLLAEMLAELPTDKPLPAPCNETLLPPAADEQSLCNSVRDEFAYAMLWEDHYARQTARQSNSFDKFLSEKELWPFPDRDAFDGLLAAGFRSFCDPSALAEGTGPRALASGGPSVRKEVAAGGLDAKLYSSRFRVCRGAEFCTGSGKVPVALVRQRGAFTHPGKSAVATQTGGFGPIGSRAAGFPGRYGSEPGSCAELPARDAEFASAAPVDRTR